MAVPLPEVINFASDSEDYSYLDYFRLEKFQDDDQDGPTVAVRTTDGLFGLLPAELMAHIFRRLTQTQTSTTLNQAMAALRCSSPGLKAAADTATLEVAFRNVAQFQAATPFMSKLDSITSVTVLQEKVNPWETHHYGLSQSPPYTSRDIDLASPIMHEKWHCLLQRLELHGVSLPQSQGSNDARGGEHPSWHHRGRRSRIMRGGSYNRNEPGKEEDDWAPDLPALRALTLRDTSVRVLDVSKCSLLRELRLAYCSQLEGFRGLSACQELRTLHLEANPRMEELHSLSGCRQLLTVTSLHNGLKLLDLAGCHTLQSLTLERNHRLVTISLQGCAGLQSMDLRGTSSLPSLDLSPCTALQKLVCNCNEAIASLVIPTSSQLTAVQVRYNPRLPGLDLPRQPALQTLDCTGNTAMVACDVAGCTGLQALSVTLNDGLSALDASGLASLATLVCTGNPGLASLRAKDCGALRTVECCRNTAMTSLELAFCPALTELVCSSNAALVNLMLLDCKGLRAVDRRWCGKLGAVDTQGCASLVNILDS